MEIFQYGLKEQVIQKIKSVFASYPDIEEVIIYGSRAKGNFRHGSDIDFIVKGEKVNHHILNKIRLELDDLLLPYTIDLALFHKIDNAEFTEHIERVGISFYQRIKT